MVSQKTLEALEGSDPPVGYIIGVRMRRQKEVNLSVLGSRKKWLESVPERSNAKDPAPFKIKEVWVENRRYVIISRLMKSRSKPRRATTCSGFCAPIPSTMPKRSLTCTQGFGRENFIGCHARDKSGGNCSAFARSTARAQQRL
jgi:hypothetical protein